MLRSRLLILTFIAAISGCTSVPPQNLVADSNNGCFEELSDFYRHVENQRDYAFPYHFDPRTPHLAYDRFSLSLTDELDTPSAKTQWLSYVAELGQQQLNVTLKLSPVSTDKQRLLNTCQQSMVKESADSTRFWSALASAPPTIPTAYQHWKRVLGAYPIATLVAESRIEAEQARIQRDFGRPIKYSVTYGESERTLSTARLRDFLESPTLHSSLNWPLLGEDAANALLDHYSPLITVETLSQDDLPGALAFESNDQLSIDIRTPTLYRSISYTHFGGEILPQLNYVIWFPARTAKGSFDPYAGEFDAVNVRITLDKEGQPLILDSIHQCGCYHMVYALEGSLGFKTLEDEKPITQYFTNAADGKRFHVTLTAGEHMIHSLSVTNNKVPNVPLNSKPLLDSLTLQQPNGEHASPYDKDGILTASARGERWFLWPFGVQSPGAMRQHGKHAIAFIGERHFDEATLFDTLLERQ